MTDSFSAVTRQHQLRWHLAAGFALLAILSVVIVEVVTVPRIQDQAQTRSFDQLESVATLKQSQILRWLDDSQAALRFLAAGPTGEALVALAQAAPAEQAQLEAQVSATLQQALDGTVSRDQGGLLNGLFVYTSEGKIVAASDTRQLGKIVIRQPYFSKSLDEDYIHPPYYVVGSDELIIIAVQRLLDRSGRTVGVLAGQLDLKTLGQIMRESTGLGETGETYLVSLENNYLLTPSRSEGYPMIMAYHSVGIDRALNGENGHAIYRDYRKPAGEVLGVYRWVPELNAALLAEVDLQEASVAAREALWLNIAIGIIASIIAGLIGFYVATRISEPISVLTQAVSRLASGKLDQRVSLRQQNEIGLLARGFNTMADRLQQTFAGLDQRIADEQQARQESEHLRHELALTLQQLEERIIVEQQAKRESDEAKAASEQLRLRLEQVVADYLSFVQTVSRGDLSQRLAINETGAMGQLGQGLNMMVESLQSLTRQIQDASTNITRAVSEIIASTAEQVTSATEQSAALAQTATTIHEVKSIAYQTAEEATKMVQENQVLLTVAEEGTQAVEQTTQGMGEIQQRVELIAHTILSLSEQMQAISSIIQTVNELADQSNLLALNAAIEAARAGEQGKSFAVVAQHVRDLADRSKVATGQVRQILGEIQTLSHKAVMVTEEGMKGVTEGNMLTHKTGQVIHRMAGEITKSVRTNIEVAGAAQQQMAGMEQIGHAMSAIKQATEQTVGSMRHAERAAKDLNALAQSLQQAVTVYRI